MSRLDQLYRSLLLTKFFTKGWGNPENLKRLFEFRKIISCRDTCQRLISPDYPVHIDKDEIQKECRILEGHFISPFTEHLPGIMPKETEMARFQVILPTSWKTKLKPVCLHLAGTGDHYFWRRRTLLARPLLKEAGIGSILLENPYYGVRKPKQQLRSSLHNVSDLFVMGGALVLESLVLFHWCERMGFGPLGITGISMGGHMASLAATNWSKPIVLVPCLSWSTASVVFTQGVMSGAIPWKLLQDQYSSESSYEDEITKLIQSPEKNRNNEAFQLGKDFARNYPTGISEMTELHDVILSTSTATENTDKRATNVTAAQMSTNASQTVHFHTRAYDKTMSNFVREFSARSSFFDRLSFSTRHQTQSPLQLQVLDFMRGVMDECTHLGNFSVPVDPNLVIIVVARSDAYVPRDQVLSLQDLWPGAEVRYIDSGHISAFLFKQGDFRKAIVDAFDKQIKKYYL